MNHNIVTKISQYQRGYTNVMNQLMYFRCGRLYFCFKELNALFLQFPHSRYFDTKEAAFLAFLQSVFKSISLQQYKTHQEVIAYIKQQMEIYP
jgi:hypothetical protein